MKNTIQTYLLSTATRVLFCKSLAYTFSFERQQRIEAVTALLVSATDLSSMVRFLQRRTVLNFVTSSSFVEALHACQTRLNRCVTRSAVRGFFRAGIANRLILWNLAAKGAHCRNLPEKTMIPVSGTIAPSLCHQYHSVVRCYSNSL